MAYPRILQKCIDKDTSIPYKEYYFGETPSDVGTDIIDINSIQFVIGDTYRIVYEEFVYPDDPEHDENYDSFIYEYIGKLSDFELIDPTACMFRVGDKRFELIQDNGLNGWFLISEMTACSIIIATSIYKIERIKNIRLH